MDEPLSIVGSILWCLLILVGILLVVHMVRQNLDNDRVHKGITKRN